MIKETRTLSKYIQATLGMTAKKYCDINNTPYRTLADAWLSEKGRTHIINQVFMMYSQDKRPATVKRFNGL